MDTHGPYEPPREYATHYCNERIPDKEAQSLYQRAISNPESITDEERELLIDLYDGEIRYNDTKIGEFIKSLRERDLLDESLLVITADHGDAFGEHGYYEHPRYLHDEITHVPLLVRPPGGGEGNVEAPASTLDVAATVADIVDQDAELPGESLLGTTRADRTVFFQARGEDEESHLRRYSLRSNQGACFCERDLEMEALEFTECRDRSLRSALAKHVEDRIRIEDGVIESDEDDVDEEIERRLSALGYK